jgi:predicted metal-dependent hydrolase
MASFWRIIMSQPDESVLFRLTLEQAACACQGSLPSQVLDGLRLFNQREYFEAHEALETAWRAERDPIRELYRGILQVGVAYYKIRKRNFNGAIKLLRRACQWLAPFPSPCRGVDVEQLRQDAQRAEQALLLLGPERIADFNPALFQPVSYSLDDPPHE